MARDLAAPPVYTGYRLTIPARETLERAGNGLRPSTEPGRWDITLRSPPTGLVDCLIGTGSPGQPDEQHHGLRLEDEPPYPGEWPASAVAWWEQGQWTPCPSCGGALVWYEAGYAPGYRLCTAGHHVQLGMGPDKPAKRVR